MMKKLSPLLFFLLLLPLAVLAQNALRPPKPTIIANLITLVDMQDGNKVKAFLTANYCTYAGKNRINDKLYYQYRAPMRNSNYAIEIPDHTGMAVSSAFYTTLSTREYTDVLNQLKNEEYQLYKNDGTNPNFLTYAKGDNLITLSIANPATKPVYTIAANKLAIY